MIMTKRQPVSVGEMITEEYLKPLGITQGQLANKLEVRSVPTIAIYQRGKIVWRKSGAMTKGQLAKAVKPFLVA